MSKNIDLEQSDEILYDKNCTNENVGLYRFKGNLQSKPDMLFILRYATHNSEKKKYMVLGRLLNYSKDSSKNVDSQSLINEQTKKIANLLSSITAYKNIKNPIISTRRDIQINQLQEFMRENKNIFNFEATKELNDIFISRESYSKIMKRTVYVPLAEEKDGTKFLDLSKAPYDQNGKSISSYNNNPYFGSLDDWKKLSEKEKKKEEIPTNNVSERHDNPFCEKMQKLTINKNDEYCELSPNQLEAIRNIQGSDNVKVKADFCKFVNDNLSEYPQIMDCIKGTSENNPSNQRKLKSLLANMAVFYQDANIQENNKKAEINIKDKPEDGMCR